MVMLRQDAKVGMLVTFGRKRGEKTRGKIIKCNPTKAKVETLEDRGRNHVKGSIWTVPYTLITPLEEYASVPGETENTTSWSRGYNESFAARYASFENEDHHIKLAINSCYVTMMDTPSAKSEEYKQIERKLKFLFLALGRELSAEEARQYVEEL